MSISPIVALSGLATHKPSQTYGAIFLFVAILVISHLISRRFRNAIPRGVAHDQLNTAPVQERARSMRSNTLRVAPNKRGHFSTSRPR